MVATTESIQIILQHFNFALKDETLDIQFIHGGTKIWESILVWRVTGLAPTLPLHIANSSSYKFVLSYQLVEILLGKNLHVSLFLHAGLSPQSC